MSAFPTLVFCEEKRTNASAVRSADIVRWDTYKLKSRATMGTKNGINYTVIQIKLAVNNFAP